MVLPEEQQAINLLYERLKAVDKSMEEIRQAIELLSTLDGKGAAKKPRKGRRGKQRTSLPNLEEQIVETIDKTLMPVVSSPPFLFAWRKHGLCI